MGVGTEEEVVVEIVKPRIDKREYKRIVLQNSLQVLLISDPDTDKVSLHNFFNPSLLTSFSLFNLIKN